MQQHHLHANWRAPFLLLPHSLSACVAFAQGMGMTTYVTGALLMGQMAHEPYTLESYILTSGWMFACFILAASFTAELASFLTAAKVASLVSRRRCFFALLWRKPDNKISDIAGSLVCLFFFLESLVVLPALVAQL